jgi:hypothetical protein
MIFFINKQAVEIKTKFESAPLTSPNEACAAIGMLYKIFGLSMPSKKDRISEMKEELHTAITNIPVPSEYAAKILKLLDDYYKDDPVTDEIYDLLKYSYDEQT